MSGTSTAASEYAYSGAAVVLRRRIGVVLWSDPDDEPHEELRAVQAMLRRLGRLLAVVVLASLLLAVLRGLR